MYVQGVPTVVDERKRRLFVRSEVTRMEERAPPAA